MDVHTYFGPADLESIRNAVAEVEKTTSGEVVPYVVGASDDYPETAWKGALFGALVVTAVAAAVHDLGGFWGGSFAVWAALPAAAGAALGFLAPRWNATVRRALADEQARVRRVQARAEAAFLSEEVFRTRERTGILLFLSLEERRVVVLGDSGINAKVEQREWDETVAEIVSGIKAGQPAAALVAGIRRCGKLLSRRGVEIRPDDRDELSDELRLEDR